MTTYQAYTGWSSGILIDLPSQPRSPGLLPAEIVESGSGLTYDDGFPVTEWQYDFLTAEEYYALNTALGLASSRSAKITAYTNRHEDEDDFVTVRAVVTKPNPNYRSGFHRDLVYRLTYIRIVP
jgi:hypothetical protein